MLLSGCDCLRSGFEKPKLTYKTHRLGDVTLDSVTLQTTWELDNPNLVGLTIARADCRIFVEDVPLATGAPSKGFDLPAHGKTEVLFPAKVKLAEVLPAAKAVAGKDYAHYRIEGTLGIQTPIGVLDYPLSYTGQFEVPKLPAVRLMAPHLTGHGIEFPIELTNRNSYPITLNGMGGTVSLAGQMLGDLSVGDLGTFGPHETRLVRVPLSLSLLQSASALSTALRHQKVQVVFNAYVVSGGRRVPFSVNESTEVTR